LRAAFSASKRRRKSASPSSTVTELEFLKSLWGLGTEEEKGYRTGPPGYIGWRNSFLGIDSWAPYHLKIRALYFWSWKMRKKHMNYFVLSLGIWTNEERLGEQGL
jgi:hypothetical protein